MLRRLIIAASLFALAAPAFALLTQQPNSNPTTVGSSNSLDKALEARAPRHVAQNQFWRCLASAPDNCACLIGDINSATANTQAEARARAISNCKRASTPGTNCTSNVHCCRNCTEETLEQSLQ